MKECPYTLFQADAKSVNRSMLSTQFVEDFAYEELALEKSSGADV
jgi:hypothetical protein